MLTADVFDVADTGERKNSRPVQLWKMNAEHEQPIIRALDAAFLYSSGYKSSASYSASVISASFASSEAAVDMFTKWLSNYLSNTAGKVRVNAVAPGYFLTPLNHDMYVNPDGSYTQRYWNVIHRTPMGRLGDPKELVGALRFFADPEMSGYITGQVIAVDGGFLSCPGI